MQNKNILDKFSRFVVVGISKVVLFTSRLVIEDHMFFCDNRTLKM